MSITIKCEFTREELKLLTLALNRYKDDPDATYLWALESIDEEYQPLEDYIKELAMN